MKRMMLLCAGISMLSIGAFAETWSGTLVDVMCKGKDLASHTTKCAVGCAKGGYGLRPALGQVDGLGSGFHLVVIALPCFL